MPISNHDTTLGDASLLDHSLICMDSNMGNSDRHEHQNAPTITSNLLLAVLDKFGVRRDTIGDSTGMLAI